MFFHKDPDEWDQYTLVQQEAFMHNLPFGLKMQAHANAEKMGELAEALFSGGPNG